MAFTIAGLGIFSLIIGLVLMVSATRELKRMPELQAQRQRLAQEMTGNEP